MDPGTATHTLDVTAASAAARREAAVTHTQDQPEATWTELTDVYQAHAEVVYRFLRRRGIRRSELEDVLQEVFVVAWRRIDRLREGASARAWLLGIAFRVASDTRRKVAREPAGPDEELLRLADPSLSPEEFTRRHRAAEVVAAFLETLSEDRREIFVLSQVEGLTAPEIAEITDTNINTIYTRMRAGRQRFAEYVATHGGREP